MKRLAPLGLLLLVPYVLLWRMNEWDGLHIPAFLSLYMAAFAIYGVAVWFTLKRSFENARFVSLFIWIIAICIRVLLLFQGPHISEDFYRYIWDGRVQNAGIGPYEHAPQDAEVQFLKDQYYDRMHQKEFKSPYPPAAEDLYRLLALLYPNLLLCKLGILFFDFLVIEMVRQLLRIWKMPAAHLLIYAWHPLPVIEFASSAHMDIMGIGLFMLALFLMEVRQRSLSGIPFAAAVLTKLLPILALPLFWKKGGWRFVLFGGLTGMLLIAQFYTPDMRMLNGISTYYKIWRYNDSMFALFYYWFGGAVPARNISEFFIFMIAAWCLAANYSMHRSLFVIYAGVIVLSPVVHPWYVCWVIPFLAFHPNRAWIFFTGWVAVSYLIRYLFPDGNWQEVLWLKLLTYVPLYALMICQLVKPQRHRDTELGFTHISTLRSD